MVATSVHHVKKVKMGPIKRKTLDGEIYHIRQVAFHTDDGLMMITLFGTDRKDLQIYHTS